MTSVNPWYPPKAMKANECCSFCGEDSHTRDNCVKLHSFGCGFVPTNQLEPGTCSINATKKSMTKIAPDFCCSESDIPLDFWGKKESQLVDHLFPLVHPPNGKHNLCGGRRKRVTAGSEVAKNEFIPDKSECLTQAAEDR